MAIDSIKNINLYNKVGTPTVTEANSRISTPSESTPVSSKANVGSSSGASETKPSVGTISNSSTEAMDKTSLSSLSRQLGGSEAPMDDSKVARIKAEIQAGSFKINFEASADGLLKHLKNLF